MLDEAHRKPCGIHRHIQLRQDVRQGSDMVLMTMGDNEAFDFLFIFHQVGNIRDHLVDTQHVAFRKRDSTVYHHDGIFVLDGGNVHSDLVKSP